REGITADLQGLVEIVGRRVDVASVELALLGERDRMHDEIERAPGFGNRREHAIEGRGFGNVAMADYETADLGRERLDALLESVALIGEGKLRTLRARCLCDAPGERAIVGDAKDQSALAPQQTSGFDHDAPRGPVPRRGRARCGSTDAVLRRKGMQKFRFSGSNAEPAGIRPPMTQRSGAFKRGRPRSAGAGIPGIPGCSLMARRARTR